MTWLFLYLLFVYKHLISVALTVCYGSILLKMLGQSYFLNVTFVRFFLFLVTSHQGPKRGLRPTVADRFQIGFVNVRLGKNNYVFNFFIKQT